MPDARHDLDTTPQALPLRSRLSLPALMSYLRTPSDQAQEWIESGWPKLTPAILVLLAPLAASGPIRAAFSLHLGVALGLGVLLTIALGAVFWPYLRAESAASRTRKSLLFEVVALAPAIYAIWALYNPTFDGFPNLGGWDGGSHVAFRRKFVSSNPAEYHGFVSLYSLTYWLERILATDAFRSFEIAYYINTATYAILPVTLALVLVRKHEGRWGTVLGTGAILGASLFFLSKIGLPLFHYNQAAAFYSHLFVIVPMAILWGADALTLKEPLRILGILFALGACRYTYGLNFPDALLAAALVVAMPSRRVQNYWIHALFVVALIGAAIAGYIALAPRFEIFGGMTIFQLDLAVAAHVGGVVVAATYILLRHHAAAGIPDPSLARLIRFVRFPLIFALVSTVAFSIYRGGEPKQDYYLAKYQFTTALLLAAVYVVIATDAALVIARLLHSRPLRRQAAAWLSLLVAGVLLVGSGKLAAKTFQIYRKGYNERVNQTKPPFTLLTALVDVEAMARIKSILAAKKSRFGGYLTTYFPRFNFMNATLNHHSGVQEFFAPDPTPGRCVFWVAPEHDIEMGGSVAVLQKHRDQIIAEGGSTCATYSVRWKATPQSLCHRCF